MTGDWVKALIELHKIDYTIDRSEVGCEKMEDRWYFSLTLCSKNLGTCLEMEFVC